MYKNLRWKLLSIVLLTILCILGVTGVPPSITSIKQRIHLGLDLKGGTHLILQVVTDDAINVETDQAIERTKEGLRSRQIAFGEVRKRDVRHIEIREVEAAKNSELRAMLDEEFRDWDRSSMAEAPNSTLLTIKPLVEQALRAQSVQQAIQTIRNRVDQLGVTEPVIQEHGVTSEYTILVQLPGVDDPGRVKEIISSTAMLELKLVENGDGPFATRESALAQNNGQLPDSKELMQSVRKAGASSDAEQGWYFVSKVASITGRDLRAARPTQDEFGKPAVSFTLNTDGAARFERVTESNIGKKLAIVLDGKIQSAPIIQGRIRDSGQITGSFTQEQADDLALVLRSGALPASMVTLEERTVGPSLGYDSIQKGVVASIIGLAAVIIFMLFYYRFSGINAVVALVLNLVIMVAALAYLKATLTLPGIAGVLLLIGMAVDSNVLIFERIREELWGKRAVVASVNLGFEKAFVTIIDTHVTTIVSVLFLFIFGTGPVKGFAVVLFWGLLANLFTSVFVSKTLFDWLLSRNPRTEKLSI
jgi:preprotein translocase subunit SecD